MTKIYLKMARIHARVKGKSGSKRPVTVDLSFVKIKKQDVEVKIIELAKADVMPSEIGIILRDTYGVPSVKAYLGKSVTQILSEKSLLTEIPEDLASLVDKAKKLQKHLSQNKKDIHNKRGLILIESKIRRLVKYYKGKNRIPANWSYN